MAHIVDLGIVITNIGLMIVTGMDNHAMARITELALGKMRKSNRRVGKHEAQ